MLGRIDKDSGIQIGKVKQYMNLIKLFYELDKSIEELGAVITTINDTQRFSKTNPAIAEKKVKLMRHLSHKEKTLDLQNPFLKKNGFY